MVKINEELSDPKLVISGNPQGGVLGLMLFILYINDLPDSVKSDIILFADDNKILQQVSSREDAVSLLEDIDAYLRRLLSFDTEKCHALAL